MPSLLINILMAATLAAPTVRVKVPTISTPSATVPATRASVPGTRPGTAGNSTLPARPGLPTISAITDLIDAKKYQQALAPIARLLELRGPAAAPYDRHQLFMLRAECQLQLKDPKAAVATLATDLKELKDIEKAYEALAFSELISRSKNGTLGIQIDQKTLVFNILDTSTRKEAYSTLFTATHKSFESAVKTARAGSTIPPILQAARMAPVSRSLEFITTGKTSRSDAIAEPLKARVVELVTNPIKDMASRVGEINKKANVLIVIDLSGEGPMTSHRQGINADEAAALANIENTCHQLISASQELAQDFPEDAKNFQDLADIATRLGSKAQSIRLDKY